MHEIEPFYNWRHLYVSEEDERSPFYGRIYSEFEFSQTIYNYYIHPQWDEFESRTLYMKVLIADYDEGVRSVVLTHRLWTSAFGGDPSVVGRALTLDGAVWRIVGVLPDTPVANTIPPTLISALTTPLKAPTHCWVPAES